MKKTIVAFFVSLCILSLHAFPQNEMMMKKAGTVPEDIQSAVFENPEENLKNLVSYLIKGVSDSNKKVRIIHDWICNNIAYDVEMYLGNTEDQDYVSVIKKRKGVCSGYSSVFVAMCELAKIPVIRIQGIAKINGQTNLRSSKRSHEWNAVKLGSKWKLVDCCWDAGFLDSGQVFVKSYSTQWLFPSAEAFIYSHLPDNEEYQFLDKKKIRTEEQFLQEPFLDADFFKYGLSLTKESPSFYNVIEGPVLYTFNLSNKPISVLAIIYNTFDEEIPGINWTEREGSKLSLEVDVPDSSLYKVKLYASNTSNNNYPIKFSKKEFETDILPRAEALVSEKPVKGQTISHEAFEQFKKAFYLEDSTTFYYYKENLFDTEQIESIKTIYELLDISSIFESVLTFYLKAADSYQGCGFNPKYPTQYDNYNEVSDFHLITPKQSFLNAGESYHFEFSGKSFSQLAFVIEGQWFYFMKKRGKNIFELDFEVPQEIKSLSAYASTKGDYFHEIIEWTIK